MEETAKKRMLSGIQPSGDLHLGNYLGAIKNWADRVNEYECYYFMADLHTITVRQEPAELRRRSLNQLAQYIACGLDPEKNVLFLQSMVPAFKINSNNIPGCNISYNRRYRSTIPFWFKYWCD